MLADALAVREDLGAVGELLARHVVEFFEKRYVAVGVVVALDPGEPVPVPDTAEVAAHLDDPDVLDAGLPQRDRGEKPGESSAEDQDLGLGRQRVALHERGVRIDFGVRGQVGGEFEVLRRPVSAQAFVPFGAVLVPQFRDIDIVWGVGGKATRSGGFAGYRGHRTATSASCIACW